MPPETIAAATASLARVRSATLAALEALAEGDNDAAYAAVLQVHAHAADAKAALGPVVRLQTWREGVTEDYQQWTSGELAEGFGK
jgi:hypothetical protein